jgi:type I restriction enzyme S subunit
MNEWQQCKLGELIEKVIDNRGKNPPYTENGYEVIETSCVSGKNKFPDYLLVKKYVDETTYKNWFRGHPKKGDILIITVGNGIGSVSIMGTSRGVITQNLIALPFLNEKADSNFYYYFLNQESMQDFLRSMNIGSAQPSLKVPHLLGVEVPLPSLPEQKAIANILSSLDDKIDLLHRQNKTLEAMAETLFRQWFIEEAVNQSERKLVLGELIESVSVTHKFPSNKIIFLNTSDIYLGNVLTYESTDVDLLPGQAKKSIQKNDILFSEIRPANGRYAYIDFDAENFVVSTKLMVLRSKNILSQSFIYFYLTNSQTLDWLQMLAESRSGTFPQITFEQIRNLKINVPTEEILDDAVNWCETAIKKIKSNQKQIQTLEKLRDNLLPKLMSGEVRMRLTEKDHVK